MELYKKHRPKTLRGLIGQDGAVASVQRLLEKGFPHAILLTGPSGCGKTTIARVLCDVLEISTADFRELNASDFKGIDTIREIRRNVNLAPMDGNARMWLIDECHKLTGDAQNAFLKLLEDTPRHVYFVLATTDPQKVIDTIHSRCTEVKLSGLGADDLMKLMRRVINKEGMEVDDSVLEDIVDGCWGSARKALVILEQVGFLEGAEAQRKAVASTLLDKENAYNLAKSLFASPRSWKTTASLLRALEKQDPEAIRYCVLGYARSVLLNDSKSSAHAAVVIDCFKDPFWNSKNAGLAVACYDALNG